MRRFILGTDWWTDCDDAVALRVMTRYVRAGRANLLGVGINACMEDSVASLKGFLLADGMTDVPIGIDLDATDYKGEPPYQKRLAEKFCPFARNEDAEDAVRLYRRLLANSESPVEIIEIGFLQVLTALLKSGADDISEKIGLELVREKVSKLWVMAGKWDADGEKENNFARTARARIAAKAFCELCPVPVTFLGWEVGVGVITGGQVPKDDPLHDVLVDFGSENGRDSWDPMLVLLALIGDEEAAGYTTVRGKASVEADTGRNHFSENANGSHAFVVKKYENGYYEKQINSIL